MPSTSTATCCAKDWQARLPSNSAPYTSTIVLLVRKGNPKQIKDWNDLARPGISVVTPNPKTSGGARWNYLAAWGYALKRWNGDEAKAREFVARVYQQRAGARFRRARLHDHVRAARHRRRARGMGERSPAGAEKLGADKFELVVPSLTILAEPPVAIVDKVVDKRGTRKVAQAYLEFLYSPEGQEIAARHYYRPRLEAARLKHAATFRHVETFTIDRGLRRVVEGAEDALCRRRRLRSDLSAWDLGSHVTYTLARRRTLPGFGPTLGLTVFYLSLLVLIPLSGLLVKAASLSWGEWWQVVTAPRALAAYRLTIGASAAAAAINMVFGVLLAWLLVRHPLPGRRIVDALVDLPFALPTAVAGIALTTVYSVNGWLGQYLEAAGRPGRLHAARHRRGSHIRRPAVCGPHGRAGAAGSRSRNGGSGGQPRSDARADLPAGDRARRCSPPR